MNSMLGFEVASPAEGLRCSIRWLMRSPPTHQSVSKTGDAAPSNWNGTNNDPNLSMVVISGP